MLIKNRFVFIYLAWLLNIISLTGSVYFSRIMDLPPCLLCWYQRISIFPMVFLMATGFLRKDHAIGWYTIPLLVFGWIISFYHNLLYYNLIPTVIETCTKDIPCTSKQMNFLDSLLSH